MAWGPSKRRTRGFVRTFAADTHRGAEKSSRACTHGRTRCDRAERPNFRESSPLSCCNRVGIAVCTRSAEAVIAQSCLMSGRARVGVASTGSRRVDFLARSAAQRPAPADLTQVHAAGVDAIDGRVGGRGRRRSELFSEHRKPDGSRSQSASSSKALCPREPQ